MMMLNFDFVLRLLVAGILGCHYRTGPGIPCQRSRLPHPFPGIIGKRAHHDCIPIWFSGNHQGKQCDAGPQPCCRTSSQRYRIHRCGYHHFPETDSQGTDNSRRNMGYCRHRIGSRCRNVHHQHCRHPAHSGRARTVEPYFQKHWHEKFRDNLFHFQQMRILPQGCLRSIQLPKTIWWCPTTWTGKCRESTPTYQVTMVIKSKKSYDEGHICCN